MVTREEILKIVINEVENNINISEISFTDSLIDQGVDSLDFNSIILSIEETYSIEITDDLIEHLDSIDSIVEFVNKNEK